MSNKLTLGEIVFGKNNSKKLQQLYFSEDVTREQATEILKAIQHPEMREVLDTLQTQMQKGMPNPRYNSHDQPERIESYLLDEANDIQESLLFTDWSYGNRFLETFYRLIEQAFPEYRLAKSQQIGEVAMERV